MPQQPTGAETRANNIIAGLRLATTLLDELHDALGTSCLQAISHTTLALAAGLQSVKKNKVECIQLLEGTHTLLYAIIDAYLKSDIPGSLSLSMLDHIGEFTETIHKIHTYLEAQQDGNRIRHFFRQSELNTLLKNCRAGLEHAMEVYKIESGANVLRDLGEMQKKADNMHKDLVEMISSLSDDGSSADGVSSVYPSMNRFQSSKSFSMLPPKPHIFHGRGSELQSIVRMLREDTARIAILGAGGMGKTTLARAILHDPDVAAKYKDCFFVPCDSATTAVTVAALIADHIGLKPGKDLTQPILRYLSTHSSCLLILDDLETTWEPLTSRKGIEELLSQLTEIPHLALMITMRGAERPAKVSWTHPFLPPLQPLSDDATRQIVFDIAEEFHDPENLDQVLRLTHNMPLAVDLIAHLVDSEGCSSVLARWESEKTSLISVGHGRRSNLDASIRISLSSPRLTSCPGAMDLLRILSILPDGLGSIELMQSSLPIPDILACRTALLGTCLAYQDDNKRLKLLVPIREHMQHFNPPSSSLIQPIQQYYHRNLDLYKKYHGSQEMATTVNQIDSNFGNLNQILLRGLKSNNAGVTDTIKCTLSLCLFSRITRHGWLSVMDHIPAALPRPIDHELEVQFLTELLMSSQRKRIDDPDKFLSQGTSHFCYLTNPVLELRFYRGLARLNDVKSKYGEVPRFLQRALSLARSCGATQEESEILQNLANTKLRIGEYLAGQTLAIEAQRLARLSANLYREADALWTEACCCQRLGDFGHSVSLLCRARDLVRLCGMSGGDLDNRILSDEAELHLLKSEYAEARQIQTRIAQTLSPEHDPINHAFALLNTAELDVAIDGNEHDVAHGLHDATALFRKSNYTTGENFCEIILARLKLKQGDIKTARPIFEKYLRQPWMDVDQISTLCLESVADIDSWSGRYHCQTAVWAVIYIAHASRHHARVELCRALQFLGKLYLAEGDELTAKSLLTVALTGFTYMDIHRGKAECMLSLGDIAEKCGQLAKASQYWTGARPLFERSLQAKKVSQINSRLTQLKQQHEEDLEHLAQLQVPSSPLQQVEMENPNARVLQGVNIVS